MGKVLFSIVLVAAAFAGGAAINGPGLRWVQAKVGRLAASDEGAAVPEKGQDPPAAGASASNGEGPSMPVPPLVIEPPQPDPAPAKPGSDPTPPRAKPDPAATKTGTPDAAGTRPASATVPAPDAPAPLDPKDLSPKIGGEPASPKPPDEAPTPASEDLSALPKLEPPVAKAKDEDEDKAAGGPAPPWSDMPGSAPATAVPPRSLARAAATAAPKDEAAEPPDPAVARAARDLAPTPPSEPEPRPAGDWADLRRQMRALGVARYGIEGEPGGRVRFHCLIPLVGRRAVGQQFEAEGSDEIQAAQAALRRVALWRATEGEHAAPARPAN
ncbi:MAG TPA: hypothetical protein VKP69_22810 [Isosphaeraceae bacterium]|nr:hypothetical protein [Isosphaeraceae bacterium]